MSVDEWTTAGWDGKAQYAEAKCFGVSLGTAWEWSKAFGAFVRYALRYSLDWYETLII
jgi:hypothetical protein